MSFASTARSFLAALTKPRRLEREMDEEWRFHLEARVDDLVAHGLSRAEAERQARREFGDPLRWKEQGREARGLRLLHELRSDVQYALRQMRRAPTVTAVITLTFALAIGANTAMFTLVDAVLLKPLPVARPEELKQLVWVARRFGFSTSYNGSARQNAAGERVATSFAYTVFTYVRDHSTTFADVFAFDDPQRMSVSLPAGAQLLETQLVSGTFFRGLGVTTTIGRPLTPDDDRAGAVPVAVISHRLWQRAFGGAASVVGERMAVNAVPVTIAGVMPPSFFGIRPGSHVDVIVPLQLQPVVDASASPDALTRPGLWAFEVLARLRPGETTERARLETETLVGQAIRANPPAAPYDAPRIVLDSGSRGLGDLRREFGSPLRILMAMVGAVLLIACANIAGLLIVRASAREREVGTRLALGAGRARLVRQLVTESVVLACTGGALGFALALALRQLLPLLVTEGSATVDLDMTVNVRLLAFTTGMCVATGIACGLLPALRATRLDVASLMGRSLSAIATRASRMWTGKGLVAAQLALSLVLLVGAGLFVRTLVNLRSEALGFRPEHLLLFRMNPTQSGYALDRVNAFYQQVTSKVEALPGVTSVSLSRYAILAGGSTKDGLFLLGSTAPPIGASIHYVAPRYFETMGINLSLGRDITWTDGARPRVAIVNESLARKLLRDQPPLDNWVVLAGEKPDDALQIIGVVADAKFSMLREPAPPTLYLPYQLRPQRYMTFAVRTASAPEGIVNAVRDAVASVDPAVAIYDTWTQEVQIEQAIRQERLFAQLATGFALLALLLACLGIYGTLSYSVSRRIPEIGLRMALGAGRSNVVGLILRESVWPIAAGLILGGGAAVAAARVVRSMLFGVVHRDALTMATAMLVLGASALIAAALPSARASRIEPMAALRQE